jgi:hypothetical protein
VVPVLSTGVKVTVTVLEVTGVYCVFPPMVADTWQLPAPLADRVLPLKEQAPLERV